MRPHVVSRWLSQIHQAAVILLFQASIMAGMPKRIGYKLRAIGRIGRAVPRILRE
jgi:hypothetical protein